MAVYIFRTISLRFFCKSSNILLKQTARMGESMAHQYIALRDGNMLGAMLLPPGKTGLVIDRKALAGNGRSFLVFGKVDLYGRS